MKLVLLTEDFVLSSFDCGDDELNKFLAEDAKNFSAARLANTFLVLEDEKIVAYFTLFNDKISRQEVANSSWRKVKKSFPHAKHLGSYPAVKIGRFAVSLEHRERGLGSKLMRILKFNLFQESGYSTFRFLTVDAYLNAIPFYEKNDFKILLSDKEPGNTQAMYFDMATL